MIGNGAFRGCENLTNITIPESVETIGNYAFEKCVELVDVTIPKGVTTIGNSAFYGCTSLESVSFPVTLTEIGEYAFYGCSSLEEVVLPNKLETLRYRAFGSCTNLTKIYIPKTITTCTVINSDGPFVNCTSIEEIEFAEGITNIPTYLFAGCDALETFEIPDTVEVIGNGAFRGCENLISITIPESVETIGNSAFYQCVELVDVTIPKGVTTIGSSAFYGCTYLESVSFPITLTKIGDYAFYGCKWLEEVELLHEVTSIGSYAFADCKYLTKIIIPRKTTTISSSAFNNVSDLVIYGVSNSYAQEYATAKGFEFVEREVAATSVVLDQKTAKAKTESTLQLTATVLPNNYTDELVWTSSNENIATVSADGLVTFKNVVGTVTITVTADKVSDSCQITVRDKNSLETPQFTIANVNGGVQIKWEFVDDATGYIIYRREAGGTFSKIAGFADGKTKSYVDKNVTNGTAYFYAVKAVNSTIQSTYTTKGITYKAAIATPTFTVANVAGGVQIKWNFVDNATGYIIYRREAGGTFSKIAGFTDGVTKSYVDKNVVDGKAYFYAVKAVNPNAQSEYTTKGINYKATLATPTFTVANAAGGVQIKWEFVDNATGYIIYRREAGGTLQKIAGFTDGKTKSYTDTNVVNGTAYFYAVKAVNTTTQSAYETKGITYKSTLATPTFTVANVSGGVQIKWEFVEGATGYIIYRREAGGVFQKVAGFTDGVTKSYTDKNVVDGTAYFYAVKAINSTTQSEYTTKGINYKASLATPTFTIANVPGGVQIKWELVDNAIGYIIYRREAGGTFSKIAGFTDGTKSYVDTNVVDGTAYFYAVKAVNNTTQSTYNTQGINYKASLAAPTFTVAKVTGGVQVDWNFVDNATGYIIYRREENGTFSKIAGFTDGKTKSYVDTTAVSGTTYYYAVKAINSTTQSTYNSVQITP